MKQALKKIATLSLGLALLAPVSLLAQKEDKDKDAKEKDKKDVEQIIITRSGNKDDKTVIEINGDKILLNGKPVEEGNNGDVRVMRNKIKDLHALTGRGNAFNFNWDNSNARTLVGNENQAMLGVTTDKVDEGAKVESVTKESAAEKAGIKKGDIITRIDNTKIEDADDLSTEIKKHKPGDKVTVTYLRDKKESKATAELTKWKGISVYGFNSPMNDFKLDLGDMDFYKSMPRAYSYSNPNQNWSFSLGGGPKLGLSVQDTDDGKGVKVLEVDEDGNAAKAGIKEDDVITEVDGKAVNGADEIAKLMKENKDKVSVKVKLNRDGKSQTVDVKIPRKLKTADL